MISRVVPSTPHVQTLPISSRVFSVPDPPATGFCVLEPPRAVLWCVAVTMDSHSELRSRPRGPVIILATHPFTVFIPNLVICHFSVPNAFTTHPWRSHSP